MMPFQAMRKKRVISAVAHANPSESPQTTTFLFRPMKVMTFVPNPVTHTSSRLLEFETLRGLLTGYASSPLGQRRIAELLPSLVRPWIETQQQLTTEIREYRRVGGRFEFAGLPEIQKLIEKSRI